MTSSRSAYIFFASTACPSVAESPYSAATIWSPFSEFHQRAAYATSDEKTILLQPLNTSTVAAAAATHNEIFLVIDPLQ